MGMSGGYISESIKLKGITYDVKNKIPGVP